LADEIFRKRLTTSALEHHGWVIFQNDRNGQYSKTGWKIEVLDSQLAK